MTKHIFLFVSAIMISTQYKAQHTNRRKMNFKRWDIQKLHNQKITKGSSQLADGYKGSTYFFGFDSARWHYGLL